MSKGSWANQNKLNELNKLNKLNKLNELNIMDKQKHKHNKLLQQFRYDRFISNI